MQKKLVPQKQMKQTAQPIKGLTTNPSRVVGPKAADIERMKVEFIKHLTNNGGVVSAALALSGLSWQEALEISRDDLFAEARRRAVDGDVVYSVDQKGRRTQQRRKSDTLLIFLMKNSEPQKKWRRRLIQAGNLALSGVRTAGTELALTEEQILWIQQAIVREFDNVSLI